MASTPLVPLRSQPAWQALEAHHADIGGHDLRALFAADPDARHTHAVEAAGWYLDYAKHRVTDETMRLLVELAGACGLAERVDAMFGGEHVNVTEDRPVLHVALRMPADASLVVDGVDVVAEVHAVLDKMARFAEQVRDGDVARPHRPPDPQRREHRDRRQRPRSGDGLRRAARVQRAGAAVPVRVERRRRRSRRRARATSTPRRRCSSSRRRRSRRSRRSRTRLGARRGCSSGSAATRPRSAGTSSRCRRTRRRSPSSGSTPRTCSSSGTGSAAATRCGRRSACR